MTRAGWIRLLLIVGALALLEAGCRYGFVSRDAVIPPTRMLEGAWRAVSSEEMRADIWLTLQNVTLSLILSLIAGTAGGLERNELVTHIQAAYVISSAGKVDFALSGGPSFFSVKQGLVSDITYTEQHPYDSATFATALTTTVGASKIGFNAGADVGVRLSKNVGVGGLVRFSRTSIEFPLPGATTNVKSDAGGVQVAGGLRLFF